MSDKPVAELTEDGIVMIYCPGCKSYHGLNVENPAGRPIWQFNNDFIKPTFHPSLLVTWTWGAERAPKCCHSFIRDGNIQFLNDCTHELVGQTVPLPPVD